MQGYAQGSHLHGTCFDGASGCVPIRQSISDLWDTYGTILMHRITFSKVLSWISDDEHGGLVIEHRIFLLFLQLWDMVSFGRKLPATHVLV